MSQSYVALKIVKHAAENYPQTVAGPLLGVDLQTGLIKITQSYSFPYTNEDGTPLRIRHNVRFQDDLLNHFKETKSAVSNLGWYQSSQNGNFINEYVLDSLASIQLKNNNSFLLIHDSSKARYGVLSLRAFRLSEAFIKVFIKNDYKIESINEIGLTFDNILEEIPIQIHNNHLISLYLAGLGSTHFNKTDQLSTSSNKTKITEQSVENLIENVDELSNFYYQQYKKKNQNSNELTLQEWLPITGGINYTSEDVQQQVLTQFLTDSSIRP
ncbi:hypothetical protein BN7_3852 [Wickerhamomyces ciferrii]|uniref:MPN domain-containing protein n=1 Tax=Wickerhamomyces ciferrii (strain ATCC 14091 / BCRC 22168 / CBS 111 / JCM 3599 / NBRC 0793 / NRRL Y-1031 F-60-10) TaxID=1206466 RepID=K0KGL8_WICCF|nr:uncharacterized protein BN7_3852 [Wickerhamomyces ciferrii]CCH44290.1 hypothetical protein BN7_3852 [Wickerhamomyces ciferrii]